VPQATTSKRQVELAQTAFLQVFRLPSVGELIRARLLGRAHFTAAELGIQKALAAEVE
jgi:hypothetical protein